MQIFYFWLVRMQSNWREFVNGYQSGLKRRRLAKALRNYGNALHEDGISFKVSRRKR